MSYFTERHGLRISNVQKSYNIDIDQYGIIFDCCEEYFDNLSWKYPKRCQDDRSKVTGVNRENLATLFRCGEIPNLFDVQNGSIQKPQKCNLYDGNTDTYDQYALLDLIEFLAKNIKDVDRGCFHPYFGHHHLILHETQLCFHDFQKKINDTFDELGLLYRLNDDKQVERVIENSPLTPEVETTLLSVKEPGLRELLNEAMSYHRSYRESDRKVAVDKIWDAFERLKTYYSEEMTGDSQKRKKDSAEKIEDLICKSESANLKEIIHDEFMTLTKKIGNGCNIRHSEIGQTEVVDLRFYDYFFNRCLSLIALAISYLE